MSTIGPREEHQSLTIERDSLIQEMAKEQRVHAGHAVIYLAEIEHLNFQNKKMVNAISFDTPVGASLGPWPREE